MGKHSGENFFVRWFCIFKSEREKNEGREEYLVLFSSNFFHVGVRGAQMEI